MAQQKLGQWVDPAAHPPADFLLCANWIWLRNSPQREVLAKSLYKPMTTCQIAGLCQRHNPKIRASDVNAHFRDMAAKGLVRVVNNRCRTGRLYYWTILGIDVMRRLGGVQFRPLDKDIDWDVFGRALSGQLWRALMSELEQPKLDSWCHENTPSGLRRAIRKHRSSDISAVSKALKALEQENLVEAVSFKKSGQRIYGITEAGRKILQWLKR